MAKMQLKHPLSFGKTSITELNFRDYATAADLLAFDEKGPNKQTIALIANLTGTDESLINQLRVDDYRAADSIASKLIRSEATEKNEQES